MNNENKHVAITNVFLPLNVVKSEGRINTWGPGSEKMCGPTHGIKVKGQMTVFCSCFVNY